MSSYKHLLFSSLLINFIFIFIFISNVLIEAQTFMDPSFNQALLPFGSQAKTGGFFQSCGIPAGENPSITVLNNCPYTVWAASLAGKGDYLDIRYRGGRRLDNGESWTLILPVQMPGVGGLIWGRTNCSFDGLGRGNCETGDCGGVLHCQVFGAPPITEVRFTLGAAIDLFHISLLNGFNIPTKVSPKTSKECSGGASCVADINEECPMALRAPGGCRHPCTVFNTSEYCERNEYSLYFKNMCPDAISYFSDNLTNTLICPTGTRYNVVFCHS